MAKLTFDYAEAKALYEHAKAAPEHRPSYDEQYAAVGDKCFDMEYDEIVKVIKEKGLLKPALHLAKDQGIYLMSNGVPNMTMTEKAPNGKEVETGKVIYARGYDPTKRDRGEVFDKAQKVSGDDFVQLIDHDICEKLFRHSPEVAQKLNINFGKTRISFSITARRTH